MEELMTEISLNYFRKAARTAEKVAAMATAQEQEAIASVLRLLKFLESHRT
jgi:hypothetical protein